MGASQKERDIRNHKQELGDQCITESQKSDSWLSLIFYPFSKAWVNGAGERKIDGKAELTTRTDQE